MSLFKRSLISIIVLLGVILLISSFFVSCSFGLGYIFPGTFDVVCKLIRENWSSVFLLLSELAALLPGPWNGILQALFRGLGTATRKNKSKH